MENTNNKTTIEELLVRDGVEQEVNVKHYELRKLTARDIHPMLKILKQVDLKRLKNVFSEIDFSELTSENNTADTEANDTTAEVETVDKTELFTKVGGAVIFEAIPMLLDALDNALEDVNKLLASVAGIELEELENLELDVYFTLIADFLNKEELMGFIRVVSRFLK